MEKGIKCPNCGYVSTKNEEYCPNCDRFEPTFEDFTKELTELKHHKDLKKVEEPQEEQTKVIASPLITEQTAPTESPVAEQPSEELPKPQATEEPEIVIEKFTPTDTQSKATKQEEVKPTAKKEKTVTPEPQPKEPKKNNNKLIALIVALILLLAAGYFGFTKYQDKKEAERVATEEKKVALLENNLNKLYFNEEKVFLSENFDATELTKLEKELAAIDKESNKNYTKEISPVIEDLSKRGKQQEAVNALFTEAIIKGDQLSDKAVLKEGELKLPEIAGKPADKFEELVNKGLEEATNQADNNKKAKELMAKVFDKEPKKEATRKEYDDAKESVEKLKNPTTKKEYQEQLDKVNKALEEKEKKEKEAKAEEQRQQDAAAAQAQANANANQQNQNQNYNQSNPNRQGISLPNEASGTMTGDWSWAPGIQEKVIGTCLQRGYIVEGGYELRQRTIINGEAYYDLYATSTQSSLLKGRSAEELPIYLVTINAKTGWFKGEGPN